MGAWRRVFAVPDHWATGPRHRRLECSPRACEKSHRMWGQHRGLVRSLSGYVAKLIVEELGRVSTGS
jgi:hypothetical protein